MYLFSIEHYCHDWSISQFPQQFAQNPWHISHLLLSWLETFVLERCCVKLVILQQILHSAQPPFICLFCFHFTVMGWRVDVKRNTSEQKFYYYNWKNHIAPSLLSLFFELISAHSKGLSEKLPKNLKKSSKTITLYFNFGKWPLTRQFSKSIQETNLRNGSSNQSFQQFVDLHYWKSQSKSFCDKILLHTSIISKDYGISSMRCTIMTPTLCCGKAQFTSEIACTD